MQLRFSCPLAGSSPHKDSLIRTETRENASTLPFFSHSIGLPYQSLASHEESIFLIKARSFSSIGAEVIV